MTEIVMVRHGETDSNVRGTYLGWTDVLLNEKGIKQASLVSKKLKNEHFDICFTSPLKRTLDTTKIILEGKDIPVKIDERLKERNFGIWDDLTFDEISDRYPEEHKHWIADLNNYVVEGGESFSGSYGRIVEFLEFLLDNYKDNKILIVTHAGCIRKIFACLTQMGIDGVWRFKVDNGTINRIEINDEGFAYISALNA